MLAADGTGGVGAPLVPGGGVAPRAPAGAPPGAAPSGNGVPSTGPNSLLSAVTLSSGGMPCASRLGSSGDGPSTCWRMANGMNGLSLLQISTVGARLPGCPMHGLLRAPRTESGESCGSLQYNPSGESQSLLAARGRPW